MGVLHRVSCRVLRGNLAPGGAIAKITGKEGLGFTGKARTFDSENDFVRAIETGSIKKGEKTVVILRYLGPKGGPGNRHMIPKFRFNKTFHRHARNVKTHESDHGRRLRSGCCMFD
jgi:dihydroxyacid dehydratase/phosphogluconate dehydratase